MRGGGTGRAGGVEGGSGNAEWGMRNKEGMKSTLEGENRRRVEREMRKIGVAKDDVED